VPVPDVADTAKTTSVSEAAEKVIGADSFNAGAEKLATRIVNNPLPAEAREGGAEVGPSSVIPSAPAVAPAATPAASPAVAPAATPAAAPAATPAATTAPAAVSAPLTSAASAGVQVQKNVTASVASGPPSPAPFVEVIVPAGGAVRPPISSSQLIVAPVQGLLGKLNPLNNNFFKATHLFVGSFLKYCSVADPNPGSGAFFTPGSGIRNRFFSGSRILDLRCRIPDPKPIFLRAY
jgi:hypothetical protein